MAFEPSCDTLAIPGSCSADQCSILAKNSDRDVTEAQLLHYFPAQEHAAGEMLRCTQIEIEQVPHTYGLIGSRPWWMWGLEMGANECGVAIGNEAEWSNAAPEDRDALLGMDLLRLALERGASAREALETIISLLEKYGQGGSCKYGVPRAESAYHNTYIICDPREIYLLETVNSQWIYRRLTDVLGVSNLYTIGEQYDACSEGLIPYAASLGLYTPGQPFDFSKSFVLLNSHSLSGFPRSRWTNRQLQSLRGRLTAESALAILRGHYEGELIENRWSPVSCCQSSVCMHGGNPGHCQSAATMVVQYHSTHFKELLYTYWGSMCPPCCSFIIPFYNTGYIPACLGVGANRYSADSFWWSVQRMVTDAESNYERYHGWCAEAQTRLEQRFRIEAHAAEARAQELLEAGAQADAVQLLNGLTDRCLAEVRQAVKALTERMEADLQVTPGQIYRQPYLRWYRGAAQL